MSALAGGLALRGAAWYWWAARRHAVETPLYAGPPLALPELGACGRRVNATLPTVACAAAYARRPAARVAAGALGDAAAAAALGDVLGAPRGGAVAWLGLNPVVAAAAAAGSAQPWLAAALFGWLACRGSTAEVELRRGCSLLRQCCF